MLPTNVEFQEYDSRVCVPLFILDDDVVENPETITVSVRSGTPRHDRISFDRRTTQIEITDNDGKCCISCKRLRKIPCVLLSSDATVRLKNKMTITNENRGSVEVCAVLEEGKSVAFRVTVGFVLRADNASV